MHNLFITICMKLGAHAKIRVIVVKADKLFGVVESEKTLGLVLCCSLLSSLSLCSLSYSSRISAGVRFLSTTSIAISKDSKDMLKLYAYYSRSSTQVLGKPGCVGRSKYLPAFHFQPFFPKDVIDGSGVLITQH